MSRCGIRNISNDCFLNSTLQCFAVSPFIRDFILNYIKDDSNLIAVINKYSLGKYKAQDIKIECNKILEMQLETISNEEKKILLHLSKHSFDIYIYLSFKVIINKLNDNKHKIITNDSFMSIANELTKYTDFEHLFRGEQNDPHELMAFLLDKLHNAKSTSTKIDIPTNLNNCNINIYHQLYLTHFKSRYENDYSYFVKNLYYYILNCIECSKCKHKSHSVCPNDMLCVSIPNLQKLQQTSNDSNTINLYDCLNHMFATDNISYKCEKCNNVENNLIQKKILSKPKTLIIKIIRYTTSRKIDNMIYYPDILNMSNYFCGELIQNYKLYAIINHTGSLNGGHYYSYVKNLKDDNKTFDDQWICCNDSRVNNISNEEAMSSNNAYILFYTLE